MKAVLLLGPTASGKSAVAMALARALPAEIVSVDSAQVYRGMDVGTAKPSAAERSEVAHHLIDIVEPTDAYSAGRFREDALPMVREIHARGRLPILVGGTMLYFRALTHGLANLPRADPDVRRELEGRAANEGWQALHAELVQVDPQTAARLHAGDSQRIQRALEVYRLTGRPLSQLQADGQGAPAPFDSIAISLEPSERAVLHERIGARFGKMLQRGLLEELQALRERHALAAPMPSMRAVGYRQAWQVLEGEAPPQTLAERGIAATRQLAKRQLTWLRSMQDLERFDCLRTDLDEVVVRRVQRYVE